MQIAFEETFYNFFLYQTSGIDVLYCNHLIFMEFKFTDIFLFDQVDTTDEFQCAEGKIHESQIESYCSMHFLKLFRYENFVPQVSNQLGSTCWAGTFNMH